MVSTNPGSGATDSGLLRNRRSSGPARFLVSRAGVAIRRHAARPGVPVSPIMQRVDRAGRMRSPNPGSCRSRVESTLGRCFTDGARREQEQALRETRHAQPAIGAVSLGLLSILEDFGVRPELVGGHSFGELVALRAAGDSTMRRSVAWPRNADS